MIIVYFNIKSDNLNEMLQGRDNNLQFLIKIDWWTELKL